MTREEFEKIPFKKGVHLAMADAYEQTYYNDKYGFVVAAITKRTQGGYGIGKSHREYNYKGKWYKKLDKFLEAIKDVKYEGND